jgi:hypothetical protein
MNGGVADATEVVEERALRGADDAALEEPVDERLLRLTRIRKEPDLRSGALREHLGEEAKLREARGGIGRVVLLGLGPERREPGIVVSEIREVR